MGEKINRKCLINKNLAGEEMNRGLIISLGGDNNEVVNIDEMSEDKINAMNLEGVGFLNVECVGVVGVVRDMIVDPQRPDSKPWYLMKVVGCHPNLIAYDGKEKAYFLHPRQIATDKLKKGKQANFNKKQFDDAIQEFLDV